MSQPTVGTRRMADNTTKLTRGDAKISVRLDEDVVKQESATTTAYSVYETANQQVTVALNTTKADPAINDEKGGSQVESPETLFSSIRIQRDPPTAANGGSGQTLNSVAKSPLPSDSPTKNRGSQKIDMLAALAVCEAKDNGTPKALMDLFNSKHANPTVTATLQRASDHVAEEPTTTTAPSVNGTSTSEVPVGLNSTTTHPRTKEEDNISYLGPQHKFSSSMLQKQSYPQTVAYLSGGSDQKLSSTEESRLKSDSPTENRGGSTTWEARSNSGETNPAPEALIHFVKSGSAKQIAGSGENLRSTEESQFKSNSPINTGDGLATCEAKPNPGDPNPAPKALIHFFKSENAKPPPTAHNQPSRTDWLHNMGQLDANRLPPQPYPNLPATKAEERNFHHSTNSLHRNSPTDTQAVSDTLLSLQNIAISSVSKQQLANSAAAAAAAAAAATPMVQPNAGIFEVYKEALEKSIQPTYVNARQYPRILIRRETRAILEAHYEKKASGKKRKGKYSYESRHLHSKKRPRNSKGQYLTKDELVEYYKQHPDEDPKLEQKKPAEDKSE